MGPVTRRSIVQDALRVPDGVLALLELYWNGETYMDGSVDDDWPMELLEMVAREEGALSIFSTRKSIALLLEVVNHDGLTSVDNIGWGGGYKDTWGQHHPFLPCAVIILIRVLECGGEARKAELSAGGAEALTRFARSVEEHHASEASGPEGRGREVADQLYAPAFEAVARIRLAGLM
jgi:hypothetical protein